MLTKSQIIESLCVGFFAASDTYVAWSGGETIHDAGIEFLATSKIAEELITKAREVDDNSWIYLEMPFSDIRIYCELKPRRGRRPLIFQGRPRVDIAYFDKTERVRGVIEVKRHLNFDLISKDADRIDRLLQYYGKPHGCLKFGCVVAIRAISIAQKKTTEQVAREIKLRLEGKLQCSVSVIVKEKILDSAGTTEYDIDNGELEIRGLSIACYYLRNKRES